MCTSSRCASSTPPCYITFCRPRRPLPPIPLHPSFAADMDHNASSQPFVSLFDSLPSSRSSAASIWAPQPQPSDVAWSQAIDSFTRVSPGAFRPDARRSSSFPISGEDVFGPVGCDGGQRRQVVGAIGDGRKKSSPPYDERVSRLYANYMRAH